jgi:hypothetical protein
MDEIIRRFCCEHPAPEQITFTTARPFDERQRKILFQQIHGLTA